MHRSAAFFLLLGGTILFAREPVKLSPDEKALFDLVNEERKKEKLPPLVLNATLTKVARQHTLNMAKHEKMAHVLDEKGSAKRVSEAGYDYMSVRENLAAAEGKPDDPPPTPAEIHEMWMKSKGHRANILEVKVTEVGISMLQSKKGTWFATQVFASPRK